MTYFMRYVTRDDHRLTLERLEFGLQASHRAYRLVKTTSAGLSGDLFWEDDCLGKLHIQTARDPDYEHTLSLLRDRLEHSSGDKQSVVELLDNAKAVVTLNVRWDDREAEITQDLLDPLWSLLYSRWDGLLNIEDDGWHDPMGIILKVGLGRV